MTKTIIKDIRDISEDDRSALEHALGESFRDDQRIVVRIETVTNKCGSDSTSSRNAETSQSAEAAEAFSKLPDWCNVFEGLSDEEVDDIDAAIKRQQLDLMR